MNEKIEKNALNQFELEEVIGEHEKQGKRIEAEFFRKNRDQIEQFVRPKNFFHIFWFWIKSIIKKNY